MPDSYAKNVQEARADERELVAVERSGAHAIVTLNDVSHLPRKLS